MDIQLHKQIKNYNKASILKHIVVKFNTTTHPLHMDLYINHSWHKAGLQPAQFCMITHIYSHSAHPIWVPWYRLHCVCSLSPA